MSSPTPVIELGKLVLALAILPIVFVLIVIGPLGWIVLAVFAIVVVYVVGKRGSEDGEGAPEKSNCPACGARITVDREVCDYCGEPLSTESVSEP